MRDQGRLIEWFDEKGYGFIQSNDASKPKVFLHIKAFTRPGPRPIIGCALEYTVNVDGQGRFQAHDVQYLKASQIKDQQKKNLSQNIQHAPQLSNMKWLCAAYFMVIFVLTLLDQLSNYVLILILLMNVLSYWLYAQDKEAAQLNRQRVPENTLHVVAFLGGWPLAWLAQQKLRHKTQKQPFRKIFFCTIVFNMLLILWLISPFNVFHF